MYITNNNDINVNKDHTKINSSKSESVKSVQLHVVLL